MKTPLDEIMMLSIPVIETGCRVWKGKTTAQGEPVFGRGRETLVKRYLTAKKYRGPVIANTFENRCGNQLCITVTHLVLPDRRCSKRSLKDH